MNSSSKRLRMRGLLSLAAVAVLLFSFAAPAFAQSTLNGYGETAPRVLGQVEGNGSEGKQSNGTSPNTNTGTPTHPGERRRVGT